MKNSKHAARVSLAPDSRGFFAASSASVTAERVGATLLCEHGEGAAKKQNLQSRISSLFPPSVRGQIYRPCAVVKVSHSEWKKIAKQMLLPDIEALDQINRSLPSFNKSVKCEQPDICQSGFRCNTRTLCDVAHKLQSNSFTMNNPAVFRTGRRPLVDAY